MATDDQTLPPASGSAALSRQPLATAAGMAAIGEIGEIGAIGAIDRLLRRLEERGLDERLAALERERRRAPALVADLLALPEPRRSRAASSARYANPEVVWRLLEVSRDAPPAAAFAQLHQARRIAIHLAALHPESSLPIQLRVEVSCEAAQRLLDAGDAASAAARLRESAADLRPDLGYARALHCRALARLRRSQQRWEEALALAERTVQLLAEHGSDAETATARVELGWLLLDAGDADDAAPLLERALPEVETIPYPAVTCRLGLAIALLESGHAHDRARIETLLAEAEWMMAQASTGAGADQPRLRWLAAQAAARCRHRAG